LETTLVIQISSEKEKTHRFALILREAWRVLLL